MNQYQQSETLGRRWGPGLLTTIPMAAAYIGSAVALPQFMASTIGFLGVLSAASVVVGAVIGGIGRAVGWYTPGGAAIDARRQGNTATQLALLLCWPVLQMLGFVQPWWAYAIAFFVLAAIGRLVFALVSGQARSAPTNNVARLQTTSFRHAARVPGMAPRRAPQIAPSWLRRLARICFMFGLLALARFAIEQRMEYLWVGSGLLLFALIVPSLVVALGGGHAAPRDTR